MRRYPLPASVPSTLSTTGPPSASVQPASGKASVTSGRPTMAASTTPAVTMASGAAKRRAPSPPTDIHTTMTQGANYFLGHDPLLAMQRGPLSAIRRRENYGIEAVSQFEVLSKAQELS
ncbi:uncharacterized protein LOC144123833 [Amblyomma americanum]